MLGYITDEQRRLAGGDYSSDDTETFSVGTDLKGADIRTLNTVGDIEELVGDCCEDLTICNDNLVACLATNTELQEEIDELEEVLEGGGGCANISYYQGPGFNGTLTGTICIVHDGVNLTQATMSVTYRSFIIIGGGASGLFAIKAYFADENGVGTGGTFDLGFRADFSYNNSQTFTIPTDLTVDFSRAIPSDAVYIYWWCCSDQSSVIGVSTL